jgi:hypothetical protein
MYSSGWEQNPLQGFSRSSNAAVNADTISCDSCPEQMHLIDNICRRSAELDVILASVQTAVAVDKLGKLTSLREQFDKVRDQIVAEAKCLAQHRLEHCC